MSDDTISGDNNETATMGNGYNSVVGNVAHYTDIYSDADGTFTITVGASGGDEMWRVNALRMHAPEPMTLTLLGIGGTAMLLRRRAGRQP